MLDDLKDFLSDFIPFVIFLVVTLIMIMGLAAIPIYYSSCKQAQIYNKGNGTNYTCGDFFWAGDQINNKTQTINLKGN